MAGSFALVQNTDCLPPYPVSQGFSSTLAVPFRHTGTLLGIYRLSADPLFKIKKNLNFHICLNLKGIAI